VEKMRQTWRRFLRLNKRDRKVVFESAVALFAAWAGLRLFGFRRWKEISERLARAKSRVRGTGEDPVHLELADRIARLEAATERHLIFQVNCLERSMALFWLCHRHGIPAVLRFGARKDGALVEAHAWIEVTGNAINAGEGNLPEFVAFDAPISAPETQIR
jgi:hypothetical protein